MQCQTYKVVDKRFYHAEFYQTVVSEHRGGVGSALLKVDTYVLPEVTWLKVYAEAAGLMVLFQPESLQTLASKASGTPIPRST